MSPGAASGAAKAEEPISKSNKINRMWANRVITEL
jgi:hypothetical protein